MLTHELRWFVEGELPEGLLAHLSREQTRSDDYLLGTGPEVGIKRRGTKQLLEHKLRRAALPITLELGEQRLLGTIESWQKSWPRSSCAPQTARWVRVDKRRRLTRVHGCRVELTAVCVLCRNSPAHRSYTLALETHDAPPAELLLPAALTLLRETPELFEHLAEAPSYGYPAWLAQLL